MVTGSLAWLHRFSRTCCMSNIVVQVVRLRFALNQPHQATHNRDQKTNQLPLMELGTLAIKHISVVSRKLWGDRASLDVCQSDYSRWLRDSPPTACVRLVLARLSQRKERDCKGPSASLRGPMNATKFPAFFQRFLLDLFPDCFDCWQVTGNSQPMCAISLISWPTIASQQKRWANQE